MIMDREQLTAGAFAESIDVAQATISHILSSRNNPSTEVILKLHKRYNDINLEEKTISINKSYQRLKGKDMITQPKTPKSIRVITMPDFLAEEFREYCSHLYGIMKKERLFRFTKSHMEHCMATGIERSGVKRIRLHDLRHSHASMLVDMGVAPLEIAERLGHEKVETTLNTYSHLYPSTQSKLAGLLDKKHEEEEE